MAVLLLAGYLSAHNISLKKQFKEDFTYIDVERTPEEARPAEAEEARREPEAGQEEEARPAPVSPAREVQVAEAARQSGPGPGRADVSIKGQAGSKSSVSEKAAGRLGGESRDNVQLARAMAGEKGADMRGMALPAPTPAGSDFKSTDLGISYSGGKAAGGRETKVGKISERPGGGSATADGGIFLGGGRSGGSAGWEKSRAAGLKGAGGGGEEKAAGLRGGREKGSAAGRDSKALFASAEGMDEVKPLKIGGPSRRAEAGGGIPGGGVKATGTLERGESALGALKGAVRASDLGSSGLSSSGGYLAGEGKARGSLGVPVAAEEGTPGSFGGEKRTALGGNVPAGRSASPEESFSARRLNLQGGQGQAGTGGAGAGPGRSQSLASLDRKAYGQGYASSGASQLVSGGAAAGRGGGGAGTGTKGVNAKALGGGGDEGEGIGGFMERAARKVSDAFGFGGKGTGGGPADSDFRRKSLSGLGPGAGSGGGGGGEGGRAGGGGVRIGGGEKSRGAGPAPGPSGGTGEGGNSRRSAGIAVAKRTSEGALGLPGDTADRYGAAGRGGGRPAPTEKKSGLGRGTQLARNTIGPLVRITSPQSGTTNRLTQVITGTVSDTRIRKATVTVNNDSRVISVDNGEFESVISLPRGRSTITVMAFDMDGNVGKDSITLQYSEPSQGAPITILSPRDGQVFDVSEKSVISVKGTIGDPDITRAKLIFNGNPIDIVVNRGYFDQKVALVQEQNTILVEAESGGKVSRSPLLAVNTINVKPKDIMLILSWNKPHADFDLHVYSPLGGHTYYKQPNIYESKDAIVGAQLEQDAKGNFGPEVFTQVHADKGVYTVRSNYFYSGGDGNASATLTVILYGDNPSRRIVRVFGPHLQVDTKNGEDTWEVTRFRMPDGIFLEE